MTAQTVALLPWGNVWEDFLDTIGISFDEFCTEWSGSWIFGYVEALDRFGIRTVLVLWSREAQWPHRRLHVPTGTVIWVLPAARAHWVARRLHQRANSFSVLDRYARHLKRSTRRAMRRAATFAPPGRARWAARRVQQRADSLIVPGRWARHLKRATRLATSLAVGYTATPPRSLAHLLKQERCGGMIVQNYEYHRFNVCVLLGRWLGLPVFATYQGGLPRKSRLEEWIHRRTMPAAAGLFIGARREATAVAARHRLSPDAVTLVSNPINVQEWMPWDQAAARTTLSLPANVPVACWHGRVDVDQKGLDILVEAWRLVCAERPNTDVRLLLCGTGSGNRGSTRLRRLIATAGLRGVHWRDEYVLDRAVVRRQLAASDVFVFPSRHEGFAVAPMEAMACARPVVACDAPGVADLLTDGERAGGVVVRREDPRALATALGRLLDDRALAAQLGETARHCIVERYSLEAVGSVLAAALHAAAPERFPSPPSSH